MNLHDLTSVVEDNRQLITDWMSQKRKEVSIPIYGSVDIRDAGWKIAVVDANGKQWACDSAFGSASAW